MGCKNCCGAQTIFPNNPRCIISIHHEMWGCFGWFTKPPSTMQWHVGLLYYQMFPYFRRTSPHQIPQKHQQLKIVTSLSSESTQNFPKPSRISKHRKWWINKNIPNCMMKRNRWVPKENWIQYHRDAIVTSLNYHFVYTPISIKVIYESIYICQLLYAQNSTYTHIYVYICINTQHKYPHM